MKLLRRLHAAMRALLGQHDPAELHAAFGVPKVDLAIAGGGAKALYAAGAYFVLQHAGFQVERVSGASSGAYVGALVVGNRYRLDDILQENLLGWGDCVVQVIWEHKTLLLGKIWEFMAAQLTKRLDGWLPRPGQLFVSVSTATSSGIAENVVSEFASPDDFECTILASMAVPFILSDGPTRPWRGRYALDGGFKNNCPVSVFRPSQTAQRGDRVIVKVDCNRIADMPTWRKFLHVVYSPGEACSRFVLEGAQDMLEVLRSGREKVSGITVIKRPHSVRKRDFSYQALPGKEHIARFAAGKPLY